MRKERTPKLCTMKEAAALIHDGDRVAFGGFAVYQKPMAMVHELIRAGKKNLTIVGSLNSLEADMLVGAGCVKRIETSYVGLEKFGMAPNFRKAVQNGEVEVVHYPEIISWDRFRADAENLDFWPVSYLGGSDIYNLNPDIVKFKNPVSGGDLYAVPSANPDVAVIHGCVADKYGNVQIQEKHLYPQSIDIAISRSTRNLIVTVEKIVSEEEIRKNAHLTMIPAFRVKALVLAPNGSHPTPVLSYNHTDEKFFREYVESSADEESYRNFMNTYVYEVEDHEAYLQRVGKEQIDALNIERSE